MDQPYEIEVGHAELSGGFSKVIPEKFTSKTEYASTQQGLPEIRVYFAHNQTHEGLKWFWVSF
jgi:hypothetical protein